MQRVLPGLRRVIHDEARAPARTHDDGRLPDTKPRVRIVIFVDVVHPEIGATRVLRAPWRFSDLPCAVTRHGPLMGQDNAYVLEQLLGLSPIAAGAAENRKGHDGEQARHDAPSTPLGALR